MRRRLLGMSVLAALSGCAVGPNYHRPAVRLPEAYAGASTPVRDTVDERLDRWWEVLGDAQLNALIERAVRANPDIEIALDRLQAARTYEQGVLSPLLPEVDASAGGGRGTGSDLARGRAAQPLVSADRTQGLTQINVVGGFDAVWELDVFGKYRRELEAAHADVRAAAAARDGVLVAVIADVARAYVALRGYQARAAILQASIGILQQSMQIAQERFDRGITNELDVTLARRELKTLEAQAAPLAAQASAAQYTIATLLGVYPEDVVKELSTPAMLPGLPASPAVGAPPTLLRRRADIQEAEARLAAATARIGVAEGELFPQLAVTAGIGVEHQGWGATPASVSEHIWSVGPAALWPLLDFGALDAQVKIADFKARALLASYRRTIENAMQEVDTAASAYSAQQASFGSLQEALAASARAVTLAQQRYDRGLTDFLNVVDAERQQYALEDQYARTQVEALTQLITLYRALGGGWQRYQDIPPVARPLPAVVALFKDLFTRQDPLRPVKAEAAP